MKKRTRSILQLIMVTLIVTLLSNFLIYATEEKSNTITIIATVNPQRIIIVDKNLTIQKIFSNTAGEVRPLVFLNAVDGEELAYSDAVINQYEGLKDSLDFSQPGVLYQREERPALAALKGIIRRIKILFFL